MNARCHLRLTFLTVRVISRKPGLRCCDWKHIEEDREKIAAGLRAGRPVIDPFGNLIVSNSLEDQLQCARIAWPIQRPANARTLVAGGTLSA